MTGPQNGSSRPEGNRAATSNNHERPATIEGQGQSIRPSFPVTGALSIDLRREDDGDKLGRRIQAAADAPPGACITFTVARGQYPPHLAVHYLIQYGRHLGNVHVLSSDPYTVEVWTAALRGERAGWAA